MAEQDQHAIADVAADGAPVLANDGSHAIAVLGDDLPQIFRVELGRKRRRADEVAEHHCELTALGGRTWRG
jgi:hypothetical protein